MARFSRVLIVSIAVIAFNSFTPQSSVGDCTCPCFYGCCYWDVVTDTPTNCTQNIAPLIRCECIPNLCTDASERKALYPSGRLVSYGSPPPGDCCTTGCFGVCFRYYKKPCYETWVCLSNSGLSCDAFNNCTIRYGSTTSHEDWWAMEACCLDVQ